MHIMTRSILTLIFSFLITNCALLQSQTKATRVVTLEGVEMTAEAAAQELFGRAMEARQDKNDEAAKHLLKQIIKNYDDSIAAKTAHVELARLWLDQRQPLRAQRILERLLVQHPYVPQADEARYLLALSQLAQGDTDAATPQLDTIVDNAGNDLDSKTKAIELAKELEDQAQDSQALRYFGQARELSDDPQEQAEIDARFMEILEGNISFREVRRLYESERKPTALREMLSVKLAKIHLHLQDKAQAKQVIAHYFQEFPKGQYGKVMNKLKQDIDKSQIVKPGRIGLLLPMSGPLKVYGKRILSAIQMAFGMEPVPFDGSKLIQTKGALTLITLDTKGEPQRALGKLDLLVDKYQIIGLIGDPSPDTALPVALRAQAYELPIISISHRSNLPLLGPYVFRLGLTPEKQAEALAEIAMGRMGLRRFAILYPRHQYGLSMMHAFWNAIQRRQGEITAIEDYSYGQTTFTSEAKKLVGRYFIESRREYLECRSDAFKVEDTYRRKKAFERCKDKVPPIVDFDAILIPDQARTVSFVVPALVAEDIPVSQDRRTMQIYRKTTGDVTARPVQLLGGSTWNNDKLAKRLQKNGEGALLVDGFSTTTTRPVALDFIKKFTKLVGSAPSRLDAQAYDAAKIIAMTLEGSGSQMINNRYQLQQALSTVQGFDGVTGELSFNAQGESESELHLFQLTKGVVQPTTTDALIEESEGG